MPGWADPTAVVSPRPCGRRRFDDAWAERFEGAKGPRDDASPQALENTLWARCALSLFDLQSTPASSSCPVSLFPLAAKRLTGAALPLPPLQALATIGHVPNEQWMARFSESAQERIGEFDAQGLATLAWAYATLGKNPGTQWLASYGEAWLRRAAEEGAHRGGDAGEGAGAGAHEIAPQSLSNTLWVRIRVLSSHLSGAAWIVQGARRLRI